MKFITVKWPGSMKFFLGMSGKMSTLIKKLSQWLQNCRLIGQFSPFVPLALLDHSCIFLFVHWYICVEPYLGSVAVTRHWTSSYRRLRPRVAYMLCNQIILVRPIMLSNFERIPSTLALPRMATSDNFTLQKDSIFSE